MVRGLSSNLGNFIAIHFLSLKTEVIHNKLPPFDGNAALFLHLKGGVHDFSRKTFAPPSCGGFHCDAFHCAFGCLLARLMSPSEQLPWSQVLQSRVVDKLVGVLTYGQGKSLRLPAQLVVRLYDMKEDVLWEGVAAHMHPVHPVHGIPASSAPCKPLYLASDANMNARDAVHADVSTLDGCKLCRTSRIGLASLGDEAVRNASVLLDQAQSTILFNPAYLTDSERTKEADHWGL